MNDLWPDDIAVSTLRAPLTILKEQAAFLGSKTKNLIIAKVEKQESDLYDEESIEHAFYVVTPALGNYRYKLFSISHSIELYPVTINLDSDIKMEIAPESGMYYLKVDNEQELVTLLTRIFGSKKTRRIIHALLAQVLDRGPEEDIPF